LSTRGTREKREKLKRALRIREGRVRENIIRILLFGPLKKQAVTEREPNSERKDLRTAGRPWRDGHEA